MKQRDDELVYDTPWCKLIQRYRGNDPDGYYLVDSHTYVCIMAMTPSKRVLLVRQYRPAAQSEIWEWPAGHVDPRETPLESAIRELKEETGHDVETLHELGCP